MQIEFRRIHDFPRGTLQELLQDAYAFDPRWERAYLDDWREFDDFFYDNPAIADACGFVTAIGGEAVGLMTWDPRPGPGWVQLGHNGVRTAFKRRGIGHAQLEEAIRRIRLTPARALRVTTSGPLLAAQRNYESVGFRFMAQRQDDSSTSFADPLLDYELELLL